MESRLKKQLSQRNLIGEKKHDITLDYKFIRRFGFGSFSKVFLAEHILTGQLRCIKKMNKNDLTDTEQVDVLSEIQLLKEIDHPNVMKIFEYYEDEYYMYIVSEYYAGGELFDFIQANGAISEQLAANIIGQILLALNYLHKNNIIHRDLKPENLVFEAKEPNALLKLIDFGSSKRIKQNEHLRAIFGTIYYIAPEVLQNNYNFKCDIWSCGVIAYILLCGKPPFNGRRDNEIIKQIKAGYIDMTDGIWKEISEEAKNFISKMLTLDPNQRPTAKELLKDPFFKKSWKEHICDEHKTEALKRLKSFKNKCQFQRIVLIFFVNFFDIRAEKRRLLEIFQEFDTDHDGYLTRDELVAAYERIGDPLTAQEDVKSVLSVLKCNEYEGIEFTEFLLANVDYKQVLNLDNLSQIFKIMDIDNNGKISKEEIKEFLHFNGNENDEVVEEIIREADLNCDGEISFEEFQEMMKQFLNK